MGAKDRITVLSFDEVYIAHICFNEFKEKVVLTTQNGTCCYGQRINIEVEATNLLYIRYTND